MKKILLATVMTMGMVTNANAFDINFTHNQNIMTEHFIGQVVKQLFPHKIVTNNAIVYRGSVANKHVQKHCYTKLVYASDGTARPIVVCR